MECKWGPGRQKKKQDQIRITEFGAELPFLVKQLNWINEWSNINNFFLVPSSFPPTSTMSPPPHARRWRAYNTDKNDENSLNSSSSDSEDVEINATMSASELYKVSMVSVIS